jgi:CubicO group peptidase (beta-lactamase class C family)
VNEDMEGIRFLLRDVVPRDISRKRIKAKIRTDTNRMNARDKKDKVPMESKAYPGEFFFFVRVNELLHGLGSKFGINMNYVDILKPYAERGLSMLPPYSEHGDSIRTVLPSLHDSISIDTILQTKVTDVLNTLQQEGHIAGAQVCVLDPNGTPLTNVAFGHCGGLKKGIAMKSDTLILGFSCTKAVAATIAHRMVQLGYLSYDECVCERVWPAFCPTAEPPPVLHDALGFSEAEVNKRWMWKRQITLRHILSHKAGLWWALPTKLTIQRLASCEECVQSFEYDNSAPENTLLPDSCPGSKTEYHFISFGWLVAGTLMGAYCRKHNLNTETITFEQVYNAILHPFLSQATLTSGFRPCGCGNGMDGGLGNVPTAFVETQDISISKLLQLQLEAESYGEKDESMKMMNGTTSNHIMTSAAAPSMQSLVKGKEFLLDQRIWNCEIGLRANCPAAGGRFSACGLAHFYHDLGTNRNILDTETLSIATAPVIDVSNPDDMNGSISFAFQGPTDMSNNNKNANATATTASDEASRRALGFGYQLISFDSDPIHEPSAFGHAGIGGSIGLYHKSSQVSIGIMLNKIDADKDTMPRILRVIQQHFQW